MKRTKKQVKQTNNPAAILTGDWHLREDQPVTRIDDFWEQQWRKVDFISKLQKKYDCDVLHSGDLFTHWKPSPYLLAKTMQHLPNKFYTVYGNHDLPQHNLQLSYKSGIEVLREAGYLTVLEECHWGEEPDKGSLLYSSSSKQKDRLILIWHIMTWKGSTPWPGCIDPSAKQIVEKYSEFDLILTGHNHETFVQDNLVNPGSIMRSSANQIDHEPCIFLWYTETNTIEKIVIPHDKNVISREHLDRVEQKDKRIQAFVNKLNTDWKVDVDFRSNLERFFAENEINRNIENIIWKSLEV